MQSHLTVIGGFVRLCLFQFAGELVALLLPLPLPGAVIGMLLLFVWLLGRPAGPDLQAAAGGLLRWLGLFFVPAAVGLSAHLGLLHAAWPQLLLVLPAASAGTIVLSGLLLQALLADRQSLLIEERSEQVAR